jgi:hypothetical protein
MTLDDKHERLDILLNRVMLNHLLPKEVHGLLVGMMRIWNA